MSHDKTVRVAAGQMTAHRLSAAADVWPAIERLADGARRGGAELLVLPECTYPAYWLGSREAYAAAGAERLPSVLARLSEIAARRRLHLVCGIVEEAGERLYNSAAVVDPHGSLIGIARKTFLWDCDNEWFSPGQAISVFDTAIGRLGVLICADARAPETTATLAAKGAELLAMPTAWVDISEDERRYNIQPDYLIEARAREFGVPFVCADKSGDEPPLAYVGQSLIATADGVVTQRGPVEGEALVIGEVAPRPARRAVVTPEQRARLLVMGDASLALPSRISGPARVENRCHNARLAVTPDGFETAGARSAELRGDEIAGFAAARCLAMDGAAVICVSDARDDLATLRTRAAENRVFVLARTSSAAYIIGPEGGIRARGDAAAGAAANVDLTEADRKEFTPRTHIWKQRRVECYEF